MLKAGVIGFGSIGKRHCENLISLGYPDITLFRQKGQGNPLELPEVSSFEKFINIPFDFVLIANPTSRHFEYLKELIPLQRNLFVEKPLVASSQELSELSKLLTTYMATGICAYNLRFHPCVNKVMELITDNKVGRIYSARFSVGQFLPDWRPASDYRTSYSAKIEMGGGVVLDLIHEIDLAFHLCGKYQSDLHAMVSKISDLEIETEDIAEIHYRSEKGALVSIHLDYLTRGYSRNFNLVGEKGTIYCDLHKSVVEYVNDEKLSESFTFESFNRNDMYFSLMKYYTECVIYGATAEPSLLEGLDSLQTALEVKSKFN